MPSFKKNPPIKKDSKNLDEIEKARLAERFLEGARGGEEISKSTEKKKGIFFRVNQSLIDDLKRIEKKTGIKPVAFCITAIMEAVKLKLLELSREK